MAGFDLKSHNSASGDDTARQIPFFDNVKQKSATKLFDKIVRQNCSTKLFDKIVRQNCSTNFMTKICDRFDRNLSVSAERKGPMAPGQSSAAGAPRHRHQQPLHRQVGASFSFHS
jgi:hypothetical protein